MTPSEPSIEAAPSRADPATPAPTPSEQRFLAPTTSPTPIPRAALTPDEQREQRFLALFNSLTKRQQDEFFRYLFKLRNKKGTTPCP